ncbi:hypothetical protein B0H13DRAFT_1918143 [Mycena leptocephala]|nr:hypothetical protein B0H13DRAFT_1918143 [Mycena leptocephala]
MSQNKFDLLQAQQQWRQRRYRYQEFVKQQAILEELRDVTKKINDLYRNIDRFQQQSHTVMESWRRSMIPIMNNRTGPCAHCARLRGTDVAPVREESIGKECQMEETSFPISFVRNERKGDRITSHWAKLRPLTNYPGLAVKPDVEPMLERIQALVAHSDIPAAPNKVLTARGLYPRGAARVATSSEHGKCVVMVFSQRAASRLKVSLQHRAVNASARLQFALASYTTGTANSLSDLHRLSPQIDGTDESQDVENILRQVHWTDDESTPIVPENIEPPLLVEPTENIQSQVQVFNVDASRNYHEIYITVKANAGSEYWL